MNSSPSIDKMLAVLKKELKSKGFHYRDVASRLKMSESTIKRHLAGRGITLAALEKLVQIVDLNLISLAVLANQEDENTPELTRVQQSFLERNKLARAVYALLAGGWMAAQIAEEFELADQMDSTLSRLQTVGLISRSTAGIRILAKPRFAVRGGGQMAQPMRDAARNLLSVINLNDENCEWMQHSARLSSASTVRLREMIRQFQLDLKTLTMNDRPMSKHDTQWYQVFVGAQPVSRKQILRDR